MIFQYYLPVVELGREASILGVYSLGVNVMFTGDETSYALETPGGMIPINLKKVANNASTYMAAVFTHAEVVNATHKGFPQFYGLNDLLPSAQWSSGSGLANVLTVYNGPVLEGLSRQNGFAVGLDTVPAVNAVLPSVSVEGTTLTANVGIWSFADSFLYQWEKFNVGWGALVGETSNQLVNPGTGTYRVIVTAVNDVAQVPVASSPATL